MSVIVNIARSRYVLKGPLPISNRFNSFKFSFDISTFSTGSSVVNTVPSVRVYACNELLMLKTDCSVTPMMLNELALIVSEKENVISPSSMSSQ